MSPCKYSSDMWRPQHRLPFYQLPQSRLVSTTDAGEWGLQRVTLNAHAHNDLTSYFTSFSKALIEEISAAINVPPIMVATLALGAFAIGVQGLYVVQRPNVPLTPLALICLFLRKTAGKKSAVMNALLLPHTKFQRAVHQSQAEDSEYEAERRAWNARVKACQSAIGKHYADHEKTHALTQQLKEIMREKPRKPRWATNILSRDASVQALAQSMHENSPSAALAYSEATRFLKHFGHDMTSFNEGYDGADIMVARRTTGTYFVERPSLSLILAAQPRPIMKFLNEKGLELIEIGFLPRALTAMCDQDMATDINQLPVSSYARDRYYAYMSSLLEASSEKIRSGDLSRTALTFSLEAQVQEEQTRQWLEWASAGNGPLSNIPEYGARCPEHIARIAAILHVMESYEGTEISLDTMVRATLIVRWYAQQYQALFGDLHMPQHERDAKAMLNFMWDCYCSTKLTQFNIRWLRQRTWGGRGLRSDMARVKDAIEYLESCNILGRITLGSRCDVFLTSQFIAMRVNRPSGIFRPLG